MSWATAEITHSFTKVAGVTYLNRDVSSRQEAIQRCCSHEQLFLEPEPENLYDRNAVRVVRETGEQLGYLPATLAASVAVDLRDGWTYVGYVAFVLPPDDMYDTYGLEILLVAVPPTATDADYQRFMDQLQTELPA